MKVTKVVALRGAPAYEMLAMEETVEVGAGELEVLVGSLERDS